jgi:hypothetical protein
MNSSTGMKGRDMPAVDNPDYDPAMRATETGFGASIEDINRGWCVEQENASDPQTGALPMPMPEEPFGFLWRGRLAIDR